MKSKIHENPKKNNTMSKKLTLILAFIGMITLNSCTTEEDNVDNDTISEVFEYENINFNAAGNYGVFLNYPQIFSSDMVLVYRLSGFDNGLDVWKLLPESYYFPDGTLDFKYDFDFTSTNVNVVIDGNDLGTISNNFLSNQVFRVVVIPGFIANKSATVNFSDYNAVVKSYNIKETDIKKMK
jgi:hypothetical protein